MTTQAAMEVAMPDWLSDEEREAMALDLGPQQEGAQGDADDGPEDEAQAASQTAQDEAPQGDDGPAGEAAPQQQATQAPEEGDVGQADVAADAQAAQQPQAPEAAPMPAAPYQYQLPQDYAQRVQALKEKFADLDERMGLGEMGAGEYGKQLRALMAEQRTLDDLQARHDLARDMAEQAQAEAQRRESAGWDAALKALIASIKDEPGAPDYNDDAVMGAALGQQVQAVLAARGFTGGPVLDKEQVLQTAHRAVQFLRTGQMPAAAVATTTTPAAAPVAVPAAPTAPAAPAVDARAAKEAVAKARAADVGRAVPTLATLPGADNGADGGEFAALNGLDGDKLEAALGKLARTNPEAYARYLAQE